MSFYQMYLLFCKDHVIYEFIVFVNALFAAKYGNQKASVQDVNNFMALCDENGDRQISKLELLEVLNKA